MLQRALAAPEQSPALNRATLSRLVREAECLIEVAHAEGADAGQLNYGPRGKTTWSWHNAVRLTLWERFHRDFYLDRQSR